MRSLKRFMYSVTGIIVCVLLPAFFVISHHLEKNFPGNDYTVTRFKRQGEDSVSGQLPGRISKGHRNRLSKNIGLDSPERKHANRFRRFDPDRKEFITGHHDSQHAGAEHPLKVRGSGWCAVDHPIAGSMPTSNREKSPAGSIRSNRAQHPGF